MSWRSSSRGGGGVSRLSNIFFLILSLGFAFGCYNFVSVLVHHNSDLRLGYRSDRSGDPVVVMPAQQKKRSLFHVALTTTEGAYTQWQCRIMYYWYKKMKNLEGSDMGGFTRILHNGKRDDLMDEIPTVVVQPLADGADRGYVVLNRPWAIVQWLEKFPIDEEYILMSEPDHIFVNPLPNLAKGEHPAAFPFFYITPDKFEKVMRKYYLEEKGPLSNIDPIGNSPVIIQKAQLMKIAPTWMNVSLKMKNDPETDRALGWVLEMYGYAVASALHGVHHILRKDFMIQPPWDHTVGNSFIIHYTYGCDYTTKGELVYGKVGEWRFDKRSHLSGPIPRNLSLPPPGVPESVVTLVKRVNEATASIPDWDRGSSKIHNSR